MEDVKVDIMVITKSVFQINQIDFLFFGFDGDLNFLFFRDFHYGVWSHQAKLSVSFNVRVLQIHFDQRD